MDLFKWHTQSAAVCSACCDLSQPLPISIKGGRDVFQVVTFLYARPCGGICAHFERHSLQAPSNIKEAKCSQLIYYSAIYLKQWNHKEVGFVWKENAVFDYNMQFILLTSDSIKQFSLSLWVMKGEG